MSESRDPYEVLGVPRDATTAKIRAAYVARARFAHPDLVGREGLDVMRTLNEAWAVLKDAAHRQAWDAAHHIAGGSASTGPAPLEDADGRPFWTGAMGPPPGRPSGPVVTFGIYDRWSLGEIARRDRGYLQWLRDRPEAETFKVELTRLLDPAANETPAPKRQKRRWRSGR